MRELECLPATMGGRGMGSIIGDIAREEKDSAAGARADDPLRAHGGAARAEAVRGPRAAREGEAW